jgi:RHH-type proline utilization regulon transcriptional repressor/proline dehydrogenase/delta 1-pyrroline-5-carboxylate dehydrogenase
VGRNEPELVERAVALASELIERAQAGGTRAQRRRARRFARMFDDPAGKTFTLELTDQILRIHDPRRAAERFHALVREHGIPTFPGPLDRLALWIGCRLAPRLPRLVMPLVSWRIRRESHGIVLPAEDPAFARHAARRAAQGVRLNVNLLGEAILGEQEAQQRADAVAAWLHRPDGDYVSVKISSIASQLDVLAFDHSVERVATRLRPLYRAAQAHAPARFVNLDMEEYRDLHLTVAAFRRVLDEAEFHRLDAGIVLQAYLPDSAEVLRGLCEWARRRRAGGGGTIKVRIVKGANLAMEQVEAELRGWPQAPYTAKSEVDANAKRMLAIALDDRYAGAVRIGVGSHNLFDVAWALVVREEFGAGGRVEIEMLEGMAEAQAGATRAVAGDLLLYAPVTARDDLEPAIAYLVRRLDENTAPENFLRSLFAIAPGNATFARERQRFERAVTERDTVTDQPRRTQDRRLPPSPSDPDAPFTNEPDTDFTLAANREWIHAVLHNWSTAPADHRRPMADLPAIEHAVETARKASEGWRSTSTAERRAQLHRAADAMAAERGHAVAVMAHEAGKPVGEGDIEVSEAIDFARWYAGSTRTLDELTAAGLSFEPHGVAVVASPWNFPYAIPAGGVLAALAAGNTVILKPAPETVTTAWVLANHLWDAGVPHDVLQILRCPDDEVGQRLITHEDVALVVLTGAYETARMFLDWKPALHLVAETSGKNAIVITSAADQDAAIRDLVRSAFGHAGQKCSAASLAIVEAGVHDDPKFLRRLADAVRSLRVGPGPDVRSTVGPLIRPASGPLADALTHLQPGERWLVEPCRIEGHRELWSPGVKLGVQSGSPFHLTECFGPVLGLMRAGDLDEAIEWQNGVAYGLTGGIHSLDPDEIDHWLDRVEVGNAYVNRHITGAIVRRQPFGGWKRSVVGPSAKAGGPNTLLTMGRWSWPRELDVTAAIRSLRDAWAMEFGVEHDPSGLQAEANVFRYRPLPNGVAVRAGTGTTDDELRVALAAARIAGVHCELSSPRPRPELDAPVEVEDDAALVARLPARGVDRLRLLAPAANELRRAAHNAGVTVDDAAITPHGRIELLHWVREQAVSRTLHRYGNLPA